ncbi:hypothetical protein L1049_001113 [Liquidambar formosana]|uniref:PGG domain-containing protein n=1 Tax=Liquidambar formosana TaxID=63359 RepID=A0AAP0NA08_LIQFO
MAFNKKNLSFADINWAHFPKWEKSPLIAYNNIEATLGVTLNKKNLSVQDILPDRATLSVDEEEYTMIDHIVQDFTSADVPFGKRNISYNDENMNYKDDGDRGKDEDNDDLTKIRKASETHLIVATLIATVMFAASFTLPGGYINDKGPDQGTPILARKAAFRAFVISNT